MESGTTVIKILQSPWSFICKLSLANNFDEVPGIHNVSFMKLILMNMCKIPVINLFSNIQIQVYQGRIYGVFPGSTLLSK